LTLASDMVQPCEKLHLNLLAKVVVLKFKTAKPMLCRLPPLLGKYRTS